MRKSSNFPFGLDRDGLEKRSTIILGVYVMKKVILSLCIVLVLVWSSDFVSARLSVSAATFEVVLFFA